MGMGTCRSCGQPIVWARSLFGKDTPLEACSLAEGNVKINKDGKAIVGQRGSGPYRSHFATCPQANQWRKRATDGGDAA
jgi:hypothetical protein